MNVEPRDEIMRLMASVPKAMEGRVSQSKELVLAKIDAIKDILKRQPEWKPDREVFGKIMEFTKGVKEARGFRRELEFNHCCQKMGQIVKVAKDLLIPAQEMNSIIQECKQQGNILMDGTLSIQQSSIDTLDAAEFWDLMRQEGVKKMVIQRVDENPIVYDEIILNRLINLKPPLHDLVEEYTIQLDGGETLVEPKAKLLLLGEEFQALLRNPMIENETKIIAVGEVSINAFSGVLRMVETGKLDPDVDPVEYQQVADRFQFEQKPLQSIPEWFNGQKALETRLGKVDPVPTPSRELVEAIQSGEITPEEYIVQWIPPRVNGAPLTLNREEQLFKSKNGIGFDKDWCNIPEPIGNQPMQGGYWLAMRKKIIQGTANMTYEQADKYVADNYPKYEILDAGDVALCVFMNNACSEKKERILDRQDFVCYTWCKGSGQVNRNTWHMAVGAFAPSGLIVRSNCDHRDDVGLLCGRKFC